MSGHVRGTCVTSRSTVSLLSEVEFIRVDVFTSYLEGMSHSIIDLVSIHVCSKGFSGGAATLRDFAFVGVTIDMSVAHLRSSRL